MGKEDSALRIVTVRNRGVSKQTMCADFDSRKVAIEVGSL